MGMQGEQIERVEALRGLMGRLCAPDLTLGEAKRLQGQLADLLGRGEHQETPDRTASPPTVALPWGPDVGTRLVATPMPFAG